jgi:hypothetical protein
MSQLDSLRSIRRGALSNENMVLPKIVASCSSSTAVNYEGSALKVSHSPSALKISHSPSYGRPPPPTQLLAMSLSKSRITSVSDLSMYADNIHVGSGDSDIGSQHRLYGGFPQERPAVGSSAPFSDHDRIISEQRHRITVLEARVAELQADNAVLITALRDTHQQWKSPTSRRSTRVLSTSVVASTSTAVVAAADNSNNNSSNNSLPFAHAATCIEAAEVATLSLLSPLRRSARKRKVQSWND